VQIYHPFLNPQGFFETFFAFFAPHRTTPCQQAFCAAIFPPKKGKQFKTFFPDRKTTAP
jgi:hypothetical protein